VKTISAWDTLRVQFYLTLPGALWGLVAPTRLGVTLLTKWNAGYATVRFLDELRSKYACGHLWTLFPFRKTLLVLDPETIDAVLKSRENFADPTLKVAAISHFAPDALVVSGGSAWADRRRFNESALGFDRLHPHSAAFRDIVFREADALVAGPARALRWSDFEAFAQRVSHQLVLGAGQAEPELAVRLARLARRGNFGAVVPFVPTDRHAFAAFYEQIDRHLDGHRATHKAAPPGGPPPQHACLMHDSAALLDNGSASETTRVPDQVAFWFHVLKDAIQLHVARTLALIAAHPEIQDRVRSEIRAVPALTAEAIDRLPLLDACLREQLRLWTAVPILLRRVHQPFALREEIDLEAGQQILIHAGFQHRDPGKGQAVDQFVPAKALDWPRLLVFSRHNQSCAGQFLARFVLKAALASLLARNRFELVAPSIGSGKIPHLCNHFEIELRPLADA
jgi:cytochrome P450